MSITAELMADLRREIESGRLTPEQVDHYTQMLWHNATWVIANHRA